MVAYTDVPEVDALYAEQATLDRGFEVLDAGGSLTMFTLMPPLPPPFDPANPPISGMPMAPVQLTTVAPSAALLDQVRASMTARYNDITVRLVELGVTGTPASL